MMRSHVSLVALALGAAVVAGALLAPPANAERIPAVQGIEVTIDVVRAKADASQFTCTAEVKDSTSGEVLSEPKIQFRADVPAQTRTTASGDRVINLEVSAKKGSETASYTVTYSKGGKVVETRKGSVKIQ